MKPRIGLLYGGLSAEREVSLVSGENVYLALQRLGYDTVKIDVDRNLPQKIIENRFDIAFIALHGTYGEDGCIQGLLDLMGIPYTHSGVLASSVCMHKPTAKAVFNHLGIETAYSRIVNKSEILAKKILHNRKYVLKPTSEGSSVNTYIFDAEHSFTEDDYPYRGEVMLEEFVQGREIQSAIVAGKAVGAIEIIPNVKSFYDYETKYTENMAEHVCPPDLPDEIYKKALDSTLKVYEFLKCRGIARADFIYNEEDNKLIMLEFNTHPGFTKLSLVPEIAQKCANISFDELVEIVINDVAKN